MIAPIGFSPSKCFIQTMQSLFLTDNASVLKRHVVKIGWHRSSEPSVHCRRQFDLPHCPAVTGLSSTFFPIKASLRLFFSIWKHFGNYEYVRKRLDLYPLSLLLMGCVPHLRQGKKVMLGNVYTFKKKQKSKNTKKGCSVRTSQEVPFQQDSYLSMLCNGPTPISLLITLITIIMR